MTCHYCRAQNDSDSHRCCRCGRRLNEDVSRSFPVQQSALAPALDPQPAAEAKPVPALPRPELVRDLPKAALQAGSGPVVQPSLFGPMAVARAAGVKPQRQSAASSRRKTEESTQGRFDFVPASTSANLSVSVQTSVACNARVAIASHRALAAAIDVALPTVGFGLFLATLHFVGQPIVLTSETLPFYGAALGLIAALYRVLCCFGNMDTIGLQWAGLQLLNFRGHRPSRNDRFVRLVGGILSTIALGIGLVWALADEERLTWHDYMSSTFPTPRFRNS